MINKYRVYSTTVHGCYSCVVVVDRKRDGVFGCDIWNGHVLPTIMCGVELLRTGCGQKNRKVLVVV